MQNVRTLKRVWQFFERLNVHLLYDPSLSKDLHRGKENICPYKELHRNVHSKLVCNSQKLKTQKDHQ